MAMKPKEILKELTLIHTDGKGNARLDNEIRVCLRGPAGCAKTAVLHQFFESIKIPCNDVYFGQLAPEDSIGMMIKDLENNCTRHLRPSWMPKLGPCATLGDEINRAHLETRQGLMEWLQFGRIHDHCMPENHAIVLAINPPGGIYQVEDLDWAMDSRMSIWDVTTNADDWLEWAAGTKGGIEALIRAYIKLYPEMLYKENIGEGPTPSPRNWELVSKLWKKGVRRLDIYKNIVGVEGAASILKFEKDKYNRVMVKDLIENYATMKAAVRKLSAGEAVDLQIQVASYVNTEGMTTNSVTLLTNVLPDMRGDLRMGLATKIDKKVMAQLINKHPAIVKALTAVTTQVAEKTK